jgi:hypothetical protein
MMHFARQRTGKKIQDVNDDAFFAWKNIELWNGNTWQGTIEEV